MKFRFARHVIDTDLAKGCYGQTALADIDGDGRPEFICGQMCDQIFWYKYHSPNDWTRHLLGVDSPSDVGACVLDVDDDGNLDFVTGGAWYRNSQDPAKPFERIVFDPQLGQVHDVFAGDIDGDGRCEVLTMSDKNTLRWYKIPDDPRRPWPMTNIGPPVHSGAALGDLSGSGSLDVVRTNVWYENVDGDGTKWIEHPIGPSTPPPPDFTEPWGSDATKCFVCDINGDGRNDIVFTDAEIPGGKVWWMENLGEGQSWKRHEIPNGDPARRGAYHTLRVMDLDGDGDFDIFSCEMEAIRGEGKPRWYIWENVDGKGGEWAEHVVLDANLGGHEAVIGDVTGNGLPDIIAKPWRPHKDNALGGKMFVVFLENVSGK